MIREEYQRFMQTLRGEGVSDRVRKVSNLILNHIDEIQPLTPHHGQRIKRIVELAQTQWVTLSTEIADAVDDPFENAATAARITSLQVGPFRGFSRSENFYLDNSLILIYGPNGTGKSSFCEALEYGLLGNIAEADSKRFRPQDYLVNAHTGLFQAPLIEAVDTDGKVAPVVANEATYRFCFVEKNRIDNFSRIAAQLPAKQTELISTLFGLDSFNEFVRNFSSEIDDRYIDLVGKNAQQLQQKSTGLAGAHQTIKDNNEALEALIAQEITLGNQYQEGMTFQQLIAALGGTENPGKIASLEAELQQPVSAKSEVTLADLQAQRRYVEDNQPILVEKEQTLAQSAESLSFKRLYEAVVTLGTVNQDQCPACKTPIAQTTNDPFQLAPQELGKLQYLSQLQVERDQLAAGISSAIQRAHQILQVATNKLGTPEQPNPLATFLLQQGVVPNIGWWQSLFVARADGFTTWQHLETQAQQLTQMDATIDKSQQLRIQKQARLTHLRELDRQVTVLQTRRKSLVDGLQKANQIIANFEKENKELIAAVEAEKALVAVNNEIAAGYSELVSQLERYRDILPRRLIADMGDTVTEMYNAVNRNDSPKDLLAGIELPLQQGQQIRIAFQGDPDTYYDALHVLSEGHIRCMGLAILMAKNLRENCPILIFDDPVNAIDEDHKDSIRRTLFEDSYFAAKQIILTCHGEEFFKDIQNLLGADRTAQSKSLTFLPQLDENHIRVDFNCAPRNYILAAQEHIGRLEIREALGKARQGLEVLTKGKVWRYVNRYGDGNLSIKLRSANQPIELRNLTEQLKLKIAKDNFRHEYKDVILAPIDKLLGPSGESREWRYLNKGTHDEEDRAEFDRATVTVIIEALSEIDTAI
ncbi:MAG: AAA family ATPase [Candidatus Thiodiazotropha sp. (ex Lucinoma borealis)]|nr:AAA family ATPase [Candidatus Thiodiazotropha sp. (ex Lucinoma borealis)]